MFRSFLIISLFIASVAQASCPQLGLPYRYLLDQKFIALTETFTIKSEKQKLGEVRRKFFAFTPSFILTNTDGDKIAEARQKLLSWGTQIEVFDCENHKIGTIKENVLFTIVFGVQKNFSLYSILDAQGRELAKSEKFEWFTTNFIITDRRGNLAAKITRPMVNFFGDNWEVTNAAPDLIDERILIMIGAYKTHADNERAAQESEANSKNKSESSSKK